MSVFESRCSSGATIQQRKLSLVVTSRCFVSSTSTEVTAKAINTACQGGSLRQTACSSPTGGILSRVVLLLNEGFKKCLRLLVHRQSPLHSTRLAR